MVYADGDRTTPYSMTSETKIGLMLVVYHMMTCLLYVGLSYENHLPYYLQRCYGMWKIRSWCGTASHTLVRSYVARLRRSTDIQV